LVSYASAMTHTIAAAEELASKGISCEVINLRSIRPLDRATLIKSIMKTNRMVTIEVGTA